jgi:hypothetical protein
MKKILYILTLAILGSAFSHMAPAKAENISLMNMAHLSSMKVTITEQGKIKYSACLPPNWPVEIHNYKPLHVYRVDVEKILNTNCEGIPSQILSEEFQMPEGNQKIVTLEDALTIIPPTV